MEVEDQAWLGALSDVGPLVQAAAQAVLDAEGAVGEGVAILLTDDGSVRDLNARFRRQDKPTNVLSFPAPQNPERFLGDVALAYGVCAREAAEQGKPLAHHLQHLVAHGVFHLLGYDHETDAQAEAMETLERAVLAGLGIPDPYATRPGSEGLA
ncbi:MAG: rRNA maturation RNase YbeY [Proteobacteria bacterium]|nr:rRNA maturation RNase YbeY [Pseudomonadota bacterium]